MKILLGNLARIALLAFLAFGMAACGGGDGSSDDTGGGDTGGGDNSDLTASAFTFTDIDNAAPGSKIVSTAVQVEGLGEGVMVDADVKGFSARMSVNGGKFHQFPRKVKNGDQLVVVVTSSATAGEAVTATVQIRNVSDEFTVTTADPGLAIANANGRFRLTWNAMSGASSYRVSEDRSGADGFTAIGTADSDATSFETSIPAHQYAWGNARFALEVCLSKNICTTVGEITPAQLDSRGVITYFTTNATVANMDFGTSVAMDGDGLTVAIGEPWRKVNHLRDGVIHIFTRETGLAGKGPWTEQATLHLPEAMLSEEAEFGTAVALSEDGNTLVAGMPFHDFSEGAVCVYQRVDGAWGPGRCLENPGGNDNDYFGYDVAIDPSGHRFIVGAPRESSDDPTDPDNNQSTWSGAAYIYEIGDETLEQVAYLKQKTIVAESKFGSAVALSHHEGNYAALIGAPEETVNGITGAGAAYLYRRFNEPLLMRMEADDPGTDDFFGQAVALANNGKDIFVGAPGDDSKNTDPNDNSPATRDSGAVYVFDAEDLFTTRQFLKAGHIAATNAFGSAIAISLDGNAAVVTVPEDDSTAAGISGNDANMDGLNTGGAYYFEKDDQGTWHQVNYLKAVDPRDRSGHGMSVAISRKGEALILGLPWYAIDNPGAAYIY